MADDGFSNPLVSNGGNLIRQWIQSPDFVAGVTGWQIARDGSAEFNDLTARGALDVGGIPGLWIGPRTHPDFPPELFAVASYKAAVVFYINSTTYEYIVTVVTGIGTGYTEYGLCDLGVLYPAYSFGGPSALNPTLALIDNFCDNSFSGVVNINGDFQFDEVSAGRGLHDDVFSAVNGAAIGAETVDQTTTATFDWKAGRAYRIDFGGLMFGSVANQVLVNMRATNVAGALWRQFRYTLPAGAAAAVECNGSGYVRRLLASGDLVNTPVALTLTASAGTVTRAGGATFPRWVKVHDVGAYVDYPDAFSI